MWLRLLNSLAFGFVVSRVTNWAKKRWGLSDPPWWLWGLVLWAALLYQVYLQGASALAAISYFFLSLLILGTMIAAFMYLPTRRHE